MQRPGFNFQQARVNGGVGCSTLDSALEMYPGFRPNALAGKTAGRNRGLSDGSSPRKLVGS